MRTKTIVKYAEFMLECVGAGVIYDIQGMAREYRISNTFICWLKANGYLQSLAGGSVKFNASKCYKKLVYDYMKRNNKTNGVYYTPKKTKQYVA